MNEGTLKDSLRKTEEALRAVEGKLERLSVCLSLLGGDPRRNIDILVEGLTVVVGGAASLYNRLDDKELSLCTWAIHNEPPGFQRRDVKEGHICYEATILGQDKPVILPNLEGTEWEARDANVKQFGLKSYLGHPVRHRGRAVGSLCVVDTKPRTFSRVDVLLLGFLAKAVELEEQRAALERELEDRLRVVDAKRAASDVPSA